MLGRKERDQLELFITGSLRQLVPDDHILARVDRVLDLSWLRDEGADLYCADNGRPGIDPEAAVRLMLAGFLLGLVAGFLLGLVAGFLLGLVAGFLLGLIAGF